LNSTVEYQNIPFSDPELPVSVKFSKSLDSHEEEELSEPRWHEALEIKYFTGGSAELNCGPRVFIASKGDIVIHNSCERHSIRRNGTGDAEYHLLMIDPKMHIGGSAGHLLEPIAEGRLRFTNHIPAQSASWQRLSPLILAAIDEFHAKQIGYELSGIGLMAQFFAELTRLEAVYDQPSAELDDIRRYGERLEHAFIMISTDYSRELTLDGLADACGMSRYHFCRVFRSVTGRTPMAYLGEYRISKAEILLRYGGMSIGEIASETGFSDICYFSRAFKRLRGVSPGQFREACNNYEKQNNPSEEQAAALT